MSAPYSVGQPAIGTQKLGNIRHLVVTLYDGQSPTPASMEFELLMEIGESLDREGIPIVDRGCNVGWSEDVDKPAQITLNGHYTGLKTRSSGNGYAINPYDFLNGNHTGAVAINTLGDKWNFGMKIKNLDQSATPESEQRDYGACELVSADLNAEPGTNKLNIVVRSLNSVPTIAIV